MSIIDANRRNSLGPRKSSLPPPYSEQLRDIELADWASSGSAGGAATSDVIVGPEASTPVPFRATGQLQIQTPGKAMHSLPTPPNPRPIPVFTLTADGHLDRPLYLSLRPKRSSGSCFLVYGDDESETPLTTTTYRFGLGKPPVVCIDDLNEPEGVQERCEVNSLGLFTRSQSLRTSLGVFEWRYANSGERKVESADNLLVLERLVSVGDQDGNTKLQTRVAQLVRNERFRTPGTCRAHAGNGGRLMLDLSGFGEKEREKMQVFVVTTALVMLKKEVDRRRRDGPYSLWWL